MLLDANEVAGTCEGWCNARFPDRVSQYLTAVARLWRGRSLAKALKAQMLRPVRERQPGIAIMSTYRRKEIGTCQTGRGPLALLLETFQPTQLFHHGVTSQTLRITEPSCDAVQFIPEKSGSHSCPPSSARVSVEAIATTLAPAAVPAANPDGASSKTMASAGSQPSRDKACR